MACQAGHACVRVSSGENSGLEISFSQVIGISVVQSLLQVGFQAPVLE